MSKFDEMCSVYTNARNEWQTYRDLCFQYLGILSRGFIAYCGIPESYISFVPLNNDPVEGRQYSLPGAIDFDDDGFWSLGLRITLFEKPNVFPHRMILVPLFLKDEGHKVLVRIGRDGDPTEIDIGNESERNRLYDRIVDTVKRYFSNGLQRAIEKPGALKVGFGPSR